MMEARALAKAIPRFLAECKNMREVKQIHAQLITSPHFSSSDHFFLISRLLFFCAVSNSGSLSYASLVFRFVENPNLFIYNAMIRGYASKSDYRSRGPRSLVLYKRMLLKCIAPDFITLPFLLKECASRLDIMVGRAIHGHSVKFGLHYDVYVENSMISLYSACGVLTCARKVFEEMPKRDTVSWNSIIIGCLRSGELDLALDLFETMDKKSIFTWNSVITGLVQGHRPKEAIAVFNDMCISRQNMIYPDKITVASVVSACALLGWLDHGKWVHGYMLRNGIEFDMVIGTSLIDMYGKCGNVEMAARVFREMPEKDVLSWTSMISVYALHGYGEEAFDLFGKMVASGLRPNAVTFGALLTACAHCGLIERGRWCFKTMESVHSIEPQVQHYACMVDILSRAGLFDEAERLIAGMPMDPDVFVWGALLGGCQMHGNVELGERIAQHLIGLEPLNHAFYVTLCDIYAKAGRFDDLKNARSLMDDRGLKKIIPGSSMIEVDGIVFEFSVRGSTEVMMEEIRSLLCWLTKETKVEEDSLLLPNGL